MQPNKTTTIISALVGVIFGMLLAAAVVAVAVPNTHATLTEQPTTLPSNNPPIVLDGSGNTKADSDTSKPGKGDKPRKGKGENVRKVIKGVIKGVGIIVGLAV